MLTDIVFYENEGWIDVAFKINGQLVQVNSSSTTVNDLLNYVSNTSCEKFFFKVFSNLEYSNSRAVRLIEYIIKLIKDKWSQIQIDQIFLKKVFQFEPSSYFIKGINSFYTGVYSGIPLKVVKHIYISDQKYVSYWTSFANNVAINSALIIEVDSSGLMEQVAEECGTFMILHFKVKHIFYLNYPFGVNTSLNTTNWNYLDIKKKMLSGDEIEIDEMVGINHMYSFFEKEGGTSVNRLHILDDNHFKANFFYNQEIKYLDFENIFLKPIDYKSLILYEGTLFFQQAEIEKGRFYFGDSSSSCFQIICKEKRIIVDLRNSKLYKVKNE
ncbi:hypothetical protein ABID30_001678 [Enterococcus rotai]|uniref:Uncharacterized protein n=1 Tax=Enterococcus rotai TaxID=118060 RepID=A0A0U2X011_9ENTE|nr:hypothetical protein [Enterococcus rotai]ALS37690.1 hypothetical protein ATZ35_11170 [Enterococcus rotai]